MNQQIKCWLQLHLISYIQIDNKKETYLKQMKKEISHYHLRYLFCLLNCETGQEVADVRKCGLSMMDVALIRNHIEICF